MDAQGHEFLNAADAMGHVAMYSRSSWKCIIKIASRNDLVAVFKGGHH
jgi:hypothetical protein